MSKIKDFYWRWLAEQLSWEHKVIYLGCVIWLLWCEKLHLPEPDLKASGLWWTSPVFFVVGLSGNKYYQLSGWWTDLQIRWVIRMMLVE